MLPSVKSESAGFMVVYSASTRTLTLERLQAWAFLAFSESLLMSHSKWVIILISEKAAPKVHNLSSAFCSEHPAVWWPTSIKSLIGFSSQVLYLRGRFFSEKVENFNVFDPESVLCERYWHFEHLHQVLKGLTFQFDINFWSRFFRNFAQTFQ